MLSGDGPDDPFTLGASRRLTLSTDIGDFPLMWTHYTHDVGVAAGDRLLWLSRSPYGSALLRHGEKHPWTATARLDERQVLVEGTWWSGSLPQSMTWRRYLPGTDDHVDVDAGLIVRQDWQWTSRTPLTSLAPPTGEESAVAPGAPDADWTLFVRVDGSDMAVSVDPGTMQQLPQEVHSDRFFTLTAIANTLRTQVR